MSITRLVVGTQEYDGYATDHEASLYLRINPLYWPTWDALEEDEREANLAAATRHLDVLPWDGAKVLASQLLAWPRSGVRHPDGSEVAIDELPAGVEQATILLAAEIALNPLVLTGEDDDARISSESAGKSVGYFFHNQGALRAYVGNEQVLRMVRPYLVSSRPPGPMVTGLDGEATISDLDRYQVERGLA